MQYTSLVNTNEAVHWAQNNVCYNYLVITDPVHLWLKFIKSLIYNSTLLYNMSIF